MAEIVVPLTRPLPLVLMRRGPKGRDGRILVGTLSCVMALLHFSDAPAVAQENSNLLRDYMVMDVCLDGAGRILADVAPTDPACSKRRNIEPGETPPYVLRSFAPGGERCSRSGRTIVKTNVPVVKQGVTRVVSTTNHLVDGDCGKAPGEDADADDSPELGRSSGASIQWHDDAYGFILGSWSPVSLSNFNSPNCQQNPHSSHRFFRGWVIGPTVLPPAGAAGSGMFQAAQTREKASSVMGNCPPRFRKALTTWLFDKAAFKSGKTLQSLIASHYSNVDHSGLAPGEAMQVERTYWTAEFGLSRWEKWARTDWTNERSRKGAMELAKILYASGRCSQPQARQVRVSPAMSVEPARMDGVYGETVVDPRTGTSHAWVMTLCEDFTNIRKGPPPPEVTATRDGADAAYWRE